MLVQENFKSVIDDKKNLRRRVFNSSIIILNFFTNFVNKKLTKIYKRFFIKSKGINIKSYLLLFFESMILKFYYFLKYNSLKFLLFYMTLHDSHELRKACTSIQIIITAPVVH